MNKIASSLTIFRIITTFAIVLLLQNTETLMVWAAICLFVLASVSDYLDGYFARKFGSNSIGVMLDPIADKILVVSVLISLVSINTIEGVNIIPVYAIVSREIFISGAREYLALQGKKLPVSYIAKIKTTVQMLAILLLILSTIKPGMHTWAIILLYISAILTVYTAVDYLKK